MMFSRLVACRTHTSYAIGWFSPDFTPRLLSLPIIGLLFDRAANEICGGTGGDLLAIGDSVCDPGKPQVDCSRLAVRANAHERYTAAAAFPLASFFFSAHLAHARAPHAVNVALLWADAAKKVDVVCVSSH